MWELRRGKSMGEAEALAHLVLPEGAEQPGEAFGLHPSLLDGAFQACIALAGGDGGEAKAALPFVLDRLELLRPLPVVAGDGIWAHLRLRPGTGGVLKFDIDLADGEGRLHARLRGFTVRVAGEISPADKVSVRPEVHGKIAELPVDISDRVAKGDLLFRLDDKDLKIEIDSRKKQIDSATLQLEQAKSEFERSKQLFEE